MKNVSFPIQCIIAFRDALAEMGYVVEDTGGGQRVREGYGV